MAKNRLIFVRKSLKTAF